MSEASIKCYMGSEEKEITQETLQSEMAKYLQMDNLSFLVGAGCSSNIVDKKETGIPLMKGLYNSFLKKSLISRLQVLSSMVNMTAILRKCLKLWVQ